MTEQENRILWQAKINALEDRRHILCRSLNPQRHYSFLRSCKMLSQEDQEKLENTCFTTSDKAGRLIDILITKGPNAFDALYNSIRTERTQDFLLQELNKSLEQQINQLRRPPAIAPPSLDDNLPNPSQS